MAQPHDTHVAELLLLIKSMVVSEEDRITMLSVGFSKMLTRLEERVAFARGGFSFPHLLDSRMRDWYSGWLLIPSGSIASIVDDEPIRLLFCLIGPGRSEEYFRVMSTVFELVEPALPLSRHVSALGHIRNREQLFCFLQDQQP